MHRRKVGIVLNLSLQFVTESPVWGAVLPDGIAPEANGRGCRKVIRTAEYREIVETFEASQRECAEVVFDHTTHTSNGISSSLRRVLVPRYPQLLVTTRGGRVFIHRTRATTHPLSSEARRALAQADIDDIERAMGRLNQKALHCEGAARLGEIAAALAPLQKRLCAAQRRLTDSEAD